MNLVACASDDRAGVVSREPEPLGGACPDRRQVRYRTYRFNLLSQDLVRQLCDLVNAPEHGDFDDDGNYQGSAFSERLIDLQTGRLSQHDCWAIIASDLSDSADSVLGWSMFERSESTPGRSGYSHGSIGIYVHPDQRGRGIAGELMSRVTKLAQDNSISALMAYPWNKRGRSFFASVGFSMAPEGCAKNTYLKVIA